MPTAAEKLSDIHRAIAYVKRSRGSIVSKPEILDMIMLNAMLRQEGAPAASRRVARLLRRKHELVQAVWKECISTGDTTIKTTTTRDMSSRTRLPITPRIVDAIQEFVRIRRQSRQRTVAKDVAHFLRSQNMLPFDPESQLSTEAAYT
ncbi:hypothetical protein H257_18701 [Aphanomyces astaci]|uniref:Uncharacterized protein n=1 Tax=Aphanomyces astaci TaxID=112090 RepID=W4FA68_APHAT|nr:hypothetical protein H257_18701 [Aphanomyces astaci]ETV64395.1 hypothetical protein H257_18701 [Aphanomyces astaci]|eukprot:XP_009846120.1 hypothetical protein H257_18701 [Aphanomyces astaci]